MVGDGGRWWEIVGACGRGARCSPPSALPSEDEHRRVSGAAAQQAHRVPAEGGRALHPQRALLGRAWPDAMPRKGQSRPSHVPAEEGCSAEVLEHLALDGELHRRLHSRPIPPPEEVLQHSGTEV